MAEEGDGFAHARALEFRLVKRGGGVGNVLAFDEPVNVDRRGDRLRREVRKGLLFDAIGRRRVESLDALDEAALDVATLEEGVGAYARRIKRRRDVGVGGSGLGGRGVAG